MINKLCLMYVTFRKNKNNLMKTRQNKCSIIQVNSNQEHSNSFEGDCFLKKNQNSSLVGRLFSYTITLNGYNWHQY